MESRRIFIGLREIAGYNENLKRGFEKLGFRCTFINQRSHPFFYEDNNTVTPVLRLQRWANTRLDGCNTMLGWIFFNSIIQILNVPLFFWVLANYDIIIFGYGSTFLHYYDLPIFRFFKKKIIYVFFGSDERPPYLNGALMGNNKGRTINECIRLTATLKKKIQRIEKYADFCISHPASAQLHTRLSIQWLAIGIPTAEQTIIDSSGQDPSSSRIRILHAPSDPETKGSDTIRNIIHDLQLKGHSIEYVEVSGKPHASVLLELQRCDFIIDQVFSDTPMAVFAAEAASFGKPAVVGGYFADQVHKVIPNDLIPPSAFHHPDKISEAIEELIKDSTLRSKMGTQAREFIEKNWTPLEVAQHYLRLIDNQAPATWYFDPKMTRYFHGAALSESQIRILIRSMIEKGGIETLQITDKPILQDLIIQFAS